VIVEPTMNQPAASQLRDVAREPRRKTMRELVKHDDRIEHLRM